MTLDEEAIAAGYVNWATLLYQRRVEARREADREARQRQAALMAKRREQQMAAGSGASECRVVPTPNF